VRSSVAAEVGLSFASAVTSRSATTKALPRALAAVALASVVCSLAGLACGLPPNPRRPRLYTVADFEALVDLDARGDPTKMVTFADGEGVPGGLPVRYFFQQKDGGYQIMLRDTWSEGKRSAYETGEFWAGFGEVWAQPVYVAITGFQDDGTPIKATDPDKKAWSPVFSVGPGSKFYSPYWQTYYFVLPDGASAEDFKSVRAVLDAGVTLIKGPPHTMSIVPAPVVAPLVAQGGKSPSQKVGVPPVASGYLDGDDVSFVDFGDNNFSVDDDLVVQEVPLFVPAYVAEMGHVKPVGAPTIAGTGPIGAGRAPYLVNGIPRYGAYWRLYTAIIPANPRMRIFSPPVFSAGGADYALPFVAAPADYGQNIIDATDTGDATKNDAAKDAMSKYVGRIALNALPTTPMGDDGCFGDLANLDGASTTAPHPCQWVDSQRALEALVPPSLINPTGITATCPFVSYADVAVPK
jgi:hypothetical protein